MLRFFRKMRQALIPENRFGRYFFYAVGEIFLVVVGILIALQVNTWNEQRKNEVKVIRILEELRKELDRDITKSTALMRHYALKDSISFLVRTNQLEMEDYINPPFTGLYTLTMNWTPMLTTRNTYDNLINNMDIVPQKYNRLLNQLNILYNSDRIHVERFNKEMDLLVDNNEEHRAKNYEWYSYDGPIGSNMGEINFMLNDYRYKNEVKLYMLSGDFHLRLTIFYRMRARVCFKIISELLNKPDVYHNYKIEKEMFDSFVGKYESIENPDIIINVFEENNTFYGNYNIDSPNVRLFMVSKSKIMDRERNFYTLIKEGDKIFVKSNKMIFKKIK